MKSLFGVASIVGLLILSGCVGQVQSEEEAPRDREPQVNTGPAEFDDTTGAIEGTVTTPELAPVAGAQVGLLPTDQLAEPPLVLTDEGGRFVLNRLPPARYQIVAQALGFNSISRSVDVVVGQVVSVPLVLEPQATTEPYIRTIHEPVQFSSIMYKLTPQCLYFAGYIPPGIPVVSENANLVKTCGGVRFGNTTVPVLGTQITRNCVPCETHTATNKKYQDFTAEWETIIGEVAWKAQTGATGKGFLFDINAPNITRGTGGSIDQASKYTWYKGTSKAPIIIRVDKNITLAERGIPEADWNNYPDAEACKAPAPRNQQGQKTAPNCDWFWRMFAAACDLNICNEGFGPDYGIMLEGKADVYFTYAVRAMAPPDFTALPDQ